MSDAPKIRVSKLSAARRQLDCATELCFLDGDAVSIHTLAAAAHQIIHDINKKNGGPPLIFDSVVIRDERREEFIARLKKDMVFFKHAERDPDGITEFVPLGSIMFMLMTTVGLQHLGETLNDIEITFHMWLTIHYPQWISDAYVQLFKQQVPSNVLADIGNLDKKEFLKGCLNAYAAI